MLPHNGEQLSYSTEMDAAVSQADAPRVAGLRGGKFVEGLALSATSRRSKWMHMEVRPMRSASLLCASEHSWNG